MLDRHRAGDWRQPLHSPTVTAFQRLQDHLEGMGKGIVLDSGCGTGASTFELARRFPDRTVVGVDKSEARLARGGVVDNPHAAGNTFLLRAELASFWRLALEAGWALERHYLFYPNPWPKPGHLQRRWHAHPVFPDMLRLGGRIEMRCNWKPYADEFAFALNRLAGSAVQPAVLEGGDPVSPFERKYRASGHALFSVVLPDQSSGVN